MAKRVFQQSNFTPTATADATPLANASYMALRIAAGAAALAKADVLEIMVSGFAGSSSPTILQFARSTVIGSSPTALAGNNSDGPEDPATAALAVPLNAYVAASVGPQRSGTATDARLNMGLNAFGGIVRWNAAPTQQWVLTGTSTPGQESTLSALTGGTVGAISAHIIYEPY